MQTPDTDALIGAGGPGPGHWLWKNFYSAVQTADPDHSAAVLQAGVIMQLYAQLKEQCQPSPERISEIYYDVELYTRGLIRILC